MKARTTSRLYLLPLLICVTACGITPDEELYGTWVDLKLDGEITLRRDGTVNWYGQETTWTLTEPRSLSCVSHHLTWTCDKEIIIDNTEPPQSIGYISEELVANPDVIQERRGDFFFRKGAFPETYVPAPFSRVEERPTILATTQYDWTYYDRTKENPLHFGSVSIDGGVTWTVLPDMPAEPSRWIDTDLAGTSTFRELTYQEEVEVENDNGEVYTEWRTVQKDLWVIDLSEESPSWRRIDGQPVSGTDWTLETGKHSSLVLILRDDGAYVSADGGQTWSEVNEANAYRFSYDGDTFVGTNSTVPFGNSIKVSRDNDIAWYDLTTGSWTLTELEWNWSSIESDTTANGGFYYLQDNALWSVGPVDGNRRIMDVTSLLPLQNDRIWGNHLSIIDGYVYLEHYGIWEAPLPSQ